MEVPAGGSFTTTVTSSFSEAGRLMVGARLRFTKRNALEANYAYSPNHLSFQGQDVVGGSSYNRVNLVGVNYVHYWSVGTRAQPFGTVGIGMNRFSGPANASAVTYGLTNASNGVQLAGNFGFGGDIVLQRHLALRFELRDYFMRQPAFISGICQGVEESVGLVYRFK